MPLRLVSDTTAAPASEPVGSFVYCPAPPERRRAQMPWTPVYWPKLYAWCGLIAFWAVVYFVTRAVYS